MTKRLNPSSLPPICSSRSATGFPHLEEVKRTRVYLPLTRPTGVGTNVCRPAMSYVVEIVERGLARGEKRRKKKSQRCRSKRRGAAADKAGSSSIHQDTRGKQLQRIPLFGSSPRPELFCASLEWSSFPKSKETDGTPRERQRECRTDHRLILELSASIEKTFYYLRSQNRQQEQVRSTPLLELHPDVHARKPCSDSLAPSGSMDEVT